MSVVVGIVGLLAVVVHGASPADRAKALLGQMTTQEKFSLVHGNNAYQPYVGNVPAITRLNIPFMGLEDGPQGVADGMRQVTAWPSALTVAASWDTDLMYQFGSAMAQEQKGKGSTVLLGPMVNIARVAVGGRNFEAFGEDPYFVSLMGVANINGIQSQKVIACVKHFVNNNQEYHRTTVSANVGERTQWEIYYPAFQAAVDAGVGSAMCSYNKINGSWACENAQTLGDLKNKMGFKGWVMSDWGATHSVVKAALAGLDQEMNTDGFFGQTLIDAVNNGQVPMSRVDDMVTRILTSMFAVGLFDETTPTGNPNANVRSDAHDRLARTLASNGTVLLKNDRSILPLDINSLRNIAVIGDDAQDAYIATGGGSGNVVMPYTVTPLQGINNVASGTKAQTTYSNSKNLQAAAQAAKNADVAIVFVATTSSEGGDRPNLSLQGNSDDLVNAVIQAQPNTIVVAHCPGAVTMPWAGKVPAILAAFLPGQEDGNAIADVLFGKVNPSGRLPLTFPIADSQVPFPSQNQYPGVNDQEPYDEGLLVGYRWYDAKNAQPLFPFGHGLSYSQFDYSNLQISGSNPATVSVTITNRGKWGGSEVAQLYVAFPAGAGEPPKGLRGFKKVDIPVGQSKVVTFDKLQSRDFSIWDENSHGWRVVSGKFTILVGPSSRNTPLQASIQI